jgi:hypothetical protein
MSKIKSICRDMFYQESFISWFSFLQTQILRVEFLHGFEVLLSFIFIPLKFANFHITPSLEWDRKKAQEKKYWLTIILKMPFFAFPCLTFHTFKMRKWEIWNEWGKICCVRQKRNGNGSNVKWIIFWRLTALTWIHVGVEILRLRWL